jgi:hypothetical protein
MRRFLAACLALVTLWSPAARADEAALAQAKASFNAGAAAYAAGDYLAAIQALNAAYRATPLPAIAFSLAQAERRQYFVSHEREHLTRAIALYRAYLTQVPVGGRRADAADALTQLEPVALSFKDTEATLATPAAPAPEKTRLLVTGSAPGARVSLDGAPAVASPLIVEVEPGPHEIRVEADGFFPEQRRVVALAGVLVPADIELREQPAVLLLAGARGADVYVDRRFAGRADKVMRLELTSGAHTLVLAKTGNELERVPVTLRRGETRRLAVRLRSTAQRTASLILLGSGGALVTGGLWLGVGALEAEALASQLLRKRASQNITPGELADYRDQVRARNQLRTASVVALSLGGAGVLTALALFELDEPNLGEALGTRAGRPLQFALAPAREGLGLDARFEF